MGISLMRKLSRYIVLFFITFSTIGTFAETKEAVAKIYGRTIYRSDLEGKGKSLESMIIPPLYEQFIKKNKIVATQSEIDEVISAMGNKLPPYKSAEEREIMQEMAKASVIDWKVSKALYEKYGGDVIFQQANPLEPIEAELRFLEEQEKAGAFKILHPHDREKFYHYYVQPRQMIIPPSRVNYEKPWWRK